MTSIWQAADTLNQRHIEPRQFKRLRWREWRHIIFHHSRWQFSVRYYDCNSLKGRYLHNFCPWNYAIQLCVLFVDFMRNSVDFAIILTGIRYIIHKHFGSGFISANWVTNSNFSRKHGEQNISLSNIMSNFYSSTSSYKRPQWMFVAFASELDTVLSCTEVRGSLIRWVAESGSCRFIKPVLCVLKPGAPE